MGNPMGRIFLMGTDIEWYYPTNTYPLPSLAAPLTALLKKEGYSWDNEAVVAFVALKTAVTTAPVLAMPNFAMLFIVECDASSHGFGAVRVQDQHPDAFFSRPVAPRHRALAAYERELIDLVQAVRHWRPYLWGRHFTVKTDHYSLKYLPDQRLATIPQHHWVGKLLGFDFSVEYRSGATNTVADALSRRDTEEGTMLAISAPRFDFIDRLRHAQAMDPELTAIHAELRAGKRTALWAMVDGMIAFDGRLYIPPASSLLQEILATVHDNGHEGIHRTLHRLRRDFHFPNMRNWVQDFVRACANLPEVQVRTPPPGGITAASTGAIHRLGGHRYRLRGGTTPRARQDGHSFRRGPLQQILPLCSPGASIHRRVHGAGILHRHSAPPRDPTIHRIRPGPSIHLGVLA
jgi:hypothetical protein